MLPIEPRAAGSGSKSANHYATLLKGFFKKPPRVWKLNSLLHIIGLPDGCQEREPIPWKILHELGDQGDRLKLTEIVIAQAPNTRP